MKFYKVFATVLVALALHSCGAYFNQPFDQTPARLGEQSRSTQNLLNLPPAQDPVEVAVYNFSDQTGQYKAVENGSTFSTAVTQGSTAILLKALEDSGWFIPIERENLSNLSTERNIIRNTKQEYIKNLNPNEPPLPPLKYAGIILEGGIVSYDTNILTGGIGARYFGLGGSAKYRQDRITVYLRMVSTSNGEILKTVYVSKTILSQALDGSLFRFVKFQRLLETEMGITRNEPVQLAVKDAVEKAVHDLIIEGIEDGFWSAKGGNTVNQDVVEAYKEEKAVAESTGLYNRIFFQQKFKNALSFDAGVSLLDADYTAKRVGGMARLGYSMALGEVVSLNLNGAYMNMKTGNTFDESFASVDLNAEFRLLRNDKLSPFVYAGGGIIMGFADNQESLGLDGNQTDAKVQYGAGLEYALSPRVGLRLWAEHDITFTDKLDNLINGKRDDYYFNFGVGLKYYFNFSSSKKTDDQQTPAVNTPKQ
ncbi:CsgG/HfaB family protein [Leeuwenhoekiella sp. H156]|uniref:CsgG/HfaB family protein n=1 Tax=Leeuwenhoekiella sp. H156 TaxID=3450128 RepID=UPI003FA46415